MDIKQLDEQLAQDEEAVAVPIYQKNGEPYLARDGSQATISVTGSDAKACVAMQATISRRMLRTRRGKWEPEDFIRNSIDLAASAVTGWHGWEDGDADWPATPENVKALLAKKHIREQVEQGIEGHADFLRSSKT